MQNRGRSQLGFSLLELLIVVAIILIIATIAIPSFLRTRQVANENSAVANLRTVSNALATYSASTGGIYCDVPTLVSGGLLDSRFTSSVSSYSITVTTSGYDFTATATPVDTNSARWGFYMTPDGVIRYSTNSTLAPAGQAGNPVSQ